MAAEGISHRVLKAAIENKKVINGHKYTYLFPKATDQDDHGRQKWGRADGMFKITGWGCPCHPSITQQTMNKGAIISTCGQYRYQLWRIWNEDKPLVLFVCLNPSTADARQDDPTIRRLTGFAYQLGYGGFYLGNLFAFRSTYPSDLPAANDPVGPDNTNHLLAMYELSNREKGGFCLGE